MAATPGGYPDRAGWLSNLGLALRIRFKRTGALADLDAAVEVGQAAVEAIPAGHPDRAGTLSNLCAALQTRFDRIGMLADIDAAVEVGQAAVAAIPDRHPARAGCLSNLGGALRARFGRTGMLADIDAAVEVGQAAVDATPAGHPDRAKWQSNVGRALRARFERTGLLADIDAAVDAVQAAVEATPAGHPARTGMLTSLGNALAARFERTGVLADLDAAVDAGQAAATATPEGHPNRAMYLTNLGSALRTRFERTGVLADIDAAVETSRAAVEATPAGHPARAGRLSNLGYALRTRFERTGVLADIDAAVETSQAAVDATPAGHRNRAMYLSNLAAALRIRFERTGALADLDAAVEAGQAVAATTPTDHPNRAGRLSNLGYALQTRFERTEAPVDLDAAVGAGQAAVGVGVAPVRVRVTAARVWGRAAALGGQWELAVDGYAAAAGLLGELAPRELARSDQEWLLAEAGGVGADAAVCAVRAGDPVRAVELFEQGRGVLLGQVLDTRGDLRPLEREHPELHARFVALAAELDQPDPAGSSPQAPGVAASGGPDEAAAGGTPDEGDLLAHRRRAARAEFDALVAEIRLRPGHGDFLRPPPLAELTPAAAGGPVVVVAVSEFGSYALVLTPHGVADPIGLAELTSQAVVDETAVFLTMLDAVASPATPPAAQPVVRHRLSETLVWLWDQLAGPVLDRLDTLGVLHSRDGGLPRVWWCLSGPLAFLPVHAAGRHETRFDPHPQTVIDRVVSSYTPTVRALAHAQAHRAACGTGGAGGQAGTDDRAVGVAMPHTPGQPDLPGVQDEVERLARRFPGRVRVITGPDATRDTVLAALPEASRAHFACHASADLTNPSASRLLLADHQTRPLTVFDVARLRLGNAELAFLSACETARPGTRITDEAIHLTSAFQLAGYRHVVGTLWPVGDQHAVDFADRVYTELAATGDVARGVHTATRQLRSRWFHDPSVWASHVHVGA